MEKLNLFDDSDSNYDLDPGLVHYQGELGYFWYNSEEFEIIDGPDIGEYLHYCGKGKSVNLPKGCINTKYMFCECILPAGFTLGDKFDTSNVTRMAEMFKGCKIPKGFTLGDHFDTSNVTNMNHMFEWAEIPTEFTLGAHFDTSSVRTMCNMFSLCTIHEGFTLGNKFNLKCAEDISWMFNESKIEKGFSLGENFIIEHYVDKDYMFHKCEYDNTPIQRYFETEDINTIIAELR